MGTSIVTVNVSITTAPKPNRLQQTGALVSVGGTTIPPYVSGGATGVAFLSQAADLTALLVAPAAITSLAWAGDVVTVTTTAPHGIPDGDEILGSIIGAAPAGYNVSGVTFTSTGASTFTYALASDPGSETTPGTWVPYAYSEIQQMVATFFAQGGSIGVYVIELGLFQEGSPSADSTAEIAALTEFINDNINPQWIYTYGVPRNWAGDSNYFTLLSDWSSPTSKTYFFTTLNAGNYASLLPSMKSGFGLIEAPGTPNAFPNSEFDVVAPMWKVLHENPSSANLATQLCYSEIDGVTPYPTVGTGPTLATYAAANINVIGTGAEGGISNTILLYGTTADGNDFQFWYSVDWVQIQADLQLSNAVINGSNNAVAPLQYNQAGINFLQAVLVQLMTSAVTYGLALGTVVSTKLDAVTFNENVENGDYAGQVVVNADPFNSYVQENPDAYGEGLYGGFTIVYTPARGFKNIVLNLNATQFA